MNPRSPSSFTDIYMYIMFKIYNYKYLINKYGIVYYLLEKKWLIWIINAGEVYEIKYIQFYTQN